MTTVPNQPVFPQHQQVQPQHQQMQPQHQQMQPQQPQQPQQGYPQQQQPWKQPGMQQRPPLQQGSGLGMPLHGPPGPMQQQMGTMRPAGAAPGHRPPQPGPLAQPMHQPGAAGAAGTAGGFPARPPGPQGPLWPRPGAQPGPGLHTQGSLGGQMGASQSGGPPAAAPSQPRPLGFAQQGMQPPQGMLQQQPQQQQQVPGQPGQGFMGPGPQQGFRPPGMPPGPPMAGAGGAMGPSGGGMYSAPPPAGISGGPPPGGMAGMVGQPAPGMGGMAGPPGPQPGMASAGQRLVEQFESLLLSAGPGAPEADVGTFPRPVGEEQAAAHAAQQPYDPGNCSAANMRPTVMGVPNSTALRLRWQLPLGVIVRPMADEALGQEVPVIPLGSHGIVRCRRCRTYMNPFCQWVDGGRRFKCNVCVMLNEVPIDYFSTLDQNGVRRDFKERPELHSGTVEWVAPQEYMVRPPMPPVYFFVIDVSAAAYACGMVSVVSSTIKACLDQLPGDERTMVGFITFDASLHFYNLKANLAAPQMLVVTELDDPFLPMPDDLLVNLHDSRELVDALLDALPAGYNASTSNDAAMGPALQAAYLVMGHVGGKLLLFQAGLPTLGPGRLKPSRDNLNLYSTEREAQLRNPEDPFFKRFAGEASSRQITLDVFLATNGYADLASLSSIPRYTCGQVYYYPGFHAGRDGPKLSAELRRNLTRPTAWEAVMRIRCSRGLKISSFHGHFFNRSTDLLALPTCDPDKTFAVQISHEETMLQTPVAFVQCALLHTSSNGERRIRVHTMMLPVLSELSELYRAADGAATACLLAKLGVEKSLMAKLEDTRQALLTKLSLSLKEYRLLHGAHVRNPGALIYPSTLRYMPAYLLGLVKCTAFRGSGRDVAADERCAAGHSLMAAPVEDTLRLAYPDIYDISSPDGNWGTEQGGKVVLPRMLPASLGYFRADGAYLINNGQVLVLWLGRDVPQAWLSQVLGPEAASPAVDPSTIPLEPPRQSPLSQRVCRLLSHLRSGHACGYALAYAVRQGMPLEAHLLPLFVEDRAQGQFGFADFLQQLHRGVMNK